MPLVSRALRDKRHCAKPRGGMRIWRDWKSLVVSQTNFKLTIIRMLHRTINLLNLLIFFFFRSIHLAKDKLCRVPPAVWRTMRRTHLCNDSGFHCLYMPPRRTVCELIMRRSEGQLIMERVHGKNSPNNCPIWAHLHWKFWHLQLTFIIKISWESNQK